MQEAEVETSKSYLLSQYHIRRIPDGSGCVSAAAYDLPGRWSTRQPCVVLPCKSWNYILEQL